MHKTLRRVSSIYRRSARLLAVGLLALSFFGPALAAAQAGSQSAVSLTVATRVTPQGAYTGVCLYVVNGNVTVSGTYNGPGINFQGTVVITDSSGAQIGNLSSGKFNPHPLPYPSQRTASFQISILGSCAGDWQTKYNIGYSLTAVDSATGQIIGTSAQGAASLSSNPTYHYIVELPLFNDSMLGSGTDSASLCPTSDNATSFMNPCYLPLGGYYNYVAFVAVVVAGVGFLVSLAAAQFDEKERKKNQILNLVITVIFIFAFPYIYNNIAVLMNYLNASVIAGPTSANVASDLNRNINTVWGAATPNLGTMWDLIFGGNLLTLAGWLVALFTYIGVYVLGIIRLWLLAAMIVAFPVSLAIKEISFARKLSNMIEDTFYGLVLASLMSAIVLGVAAAIIGPGETMSNNTIFGGGSTTFVASIALLTAIFMPTILAPLTGTLMQTGQQMAMTAGSIAALTTVGGAMGGVGGFTSGAMSPASLAKAGVSAEQFAGMSTGQRLAAAVQHGNIFGGIAGALGGGFRNVGVAAAMGISSGFGMGQLPKVIGRITPISTPGTMGYEAAQRLGAQVSVQHQKMADLAVPAMLGPARRLVAEGAGGIRQHFGWVPNSSGVLYSPINLLAGHDYAEGSRIRRERISLASRPEALAADDIQHGMMQTSLASNPVAVKEYAKQQQILWKGIPDPVKLAKKGLTVEADKALLQIENLANHRGANEHFAKSSR